MIRAFIVAILCSASTVFAQDKFSVEDQNGKLTITKAPCTKAGPWFAKWRAATWVYKGKFYDACWSGVRTPDGGQMVVVIDSDGQVSNMHPSRFSPEQGI